MIAARPQSRISSFDEPARLGAEHESRRLVGVQSGRHRGHGDAHVLDGRPSARRRRPVSATASAGTRQRRPRGRRTRAPARAARARPRRCASTRACASRPAAPGRAPRHPVLRATRAQAPTLAAVSGRTSTIRNSRHGAQAVGSSLRRAASGQWRRKRRDVRVLPAVVHEVRAQPLAVHVGHRDELQSRAGAAATSRRAPPPRGATTPRGSWARNGQLAARPREADLDRLSGRERLVVLDEHALEGDVDQERLFLRRPALRAWRAGRTGCAAAAARSRAAESRHGTCEIGHHRLKDRSTGSGGAVNAR